MPDRLPTVEYDEREIVRCVDRTKGCVTFKGREWRVPRAFCEERLAIRPRDTDGRFGIFLPSIRSQRSICATPRVSTMSPNRS